MATEDYYGLAEKYLKECDADLEECRMILEKLEDVLRSTPKPSEQLGW